MTPGFTRLQIAGSWAINSAYRPNRRGSGSAPSCELDVGWYSGPPAATRYAGSGFAKQAPSRVGHKNPHQELDRQREAGRLPWVQPWDSAACGCTMPHNAGTGRRYSGINVLILWAAVIEGGYASQRWLTYRQAQAAGGNVRRTLGEPNDFEGNLATELAITRAVHGSHAAAS